MCKSVSMTDLSKMVQRLAGWSQAAFKSFDLTGDIDDRADLPQLAAGDFGNVTFEVITIRLTNLSYIDADAFAANLETTLKLSLPYNLLTEQAFDATSRFKKLQVLRLAYNRIARVPPSAFSPDQRDLHRVDLAFNHITAVEESVFSQLINLRRLDLSNNRITFIDSHAFVPAIALRPHNHTLVVDLDVNDLTWTSFHNDSLKGNHILRLNLSVNKISVMREEVFADVFQARGSVDMKWNPLTCDCSFPQYLLQLNRSVCRNCRCANGTEIFRLQPSGFDCSGGQPLVQPCIVRHLAHYLRPNPRLSISKDLP